MKNRLFSSIASTQLWRGTYNAAARRAFRRDNGVALFLAISLLALLSVMGASYMRFMSLELDGSDIRVRRMRARHYAAAGVYNAAGHIQAALAADELPAPDYIFSYPLYDGRHDPETYRPTELTAYVAEARVSVGVFDQEAWTERFASTPDWPGDGRVFRVVSAAMVQRAVPGGMHTLARHAVEAVLVSDGNGCEILCWSAHQEDTS